MKFEEQVDDQQKNISVMFQDSLKSDIAKLSSVVGTIDANEKKFLAELQTVTDQVFPHILSTHFPAARPFLPLISAPTGFHD